MANELSAHRTREYADFIHCPVQLAGRVPSVIVFKELQVSIGR